MEKYSVLMSVYYKEKAEYFRLAVESMLNQTISPDDFVIVCDGPLTEELEREITFFTTRYPGLFQIIRLEKNSGLGKALNQGITYCKNEFVARMDSDDISLPDRIENQFKVFDNNPVVSVVGGQIAEFEYDPAEIKAYRIVPCSYADILKRVKSRNPVNHMTVMFKKSVIVNAGGYPDIHLFEDYALWATLIAEKKIFINVEHLCCYMRTGEGMYSRRGGASYFKSIKKIEKLLLKKKLISYPQYIVNLAVRFFGSIVVSDSIRKYLYKKLLRKNKG